MTDAPTESHLPPESPSAVDMSAIERVESFVDGWKAELTGQVSVSASGVQDRLLDLWGRLEEGDARSRVESWLTETLERQLYEVADVERRLAELVPQGSSAS